MPPFTRTLEIKTRANALPKATSLLLSFEKIQGLATDQAKVCWKVVKFPANQEMSVSITFSSQLCFIHSQVNSGNVISAATAKDVHDGEQTKLVVDKDSGVAMFTNPTPDPSVGAEMIRCQNKTGAISALAVGTRDTPDGDPNPVMFFENIPDDSGVLVKFTPILLAYVTSNYVSNEIIRGEVDSAEILRQDLKALSEKTTWHLEWDSTTGKSSLVKSA
ncbi:hypothetical protein FRC14_005422 [Serendipita sp. 396]|nr:hypothetical protein FRC14_005422 [Serendipita sp. 396]KAG8797433.1 hypothetical protein FRC16_008867 [Serendipita sp. 398]KAG8826021.1 hypothetical protein FRC19_009963 [Serendipita sp. 401]KAG8833293.1 hypothetical protein FRC18_003877 [Serendipita sp. 400]KAG8853706.1 hypothetical protein FRB91_004470 [Serendipita sp. 411]KAG8865972.1 hypothetical protein FRC20_009223 [Serendipita sp. 405]KAG9056794.1 hypothetical protein FS842_009607 [Serendipita sp. 407]